MKMIKWRDRCSRENRFRCNCGNSVKIELQLAISDVGCRELVPCSTHDLYAEIQSYRDSCDMQTLLKTIDPNSLANAVSTYKVDDIMNSGIVDYTQMPDTLGGMYNLVRKADNLFSGLPATVRAEFNNSVKVFVSKFGTPEFSDIINKYVTPAVSSPVTLDEPALDEPALDEPVKKRGRPRKVVNDE